MKNVFRVLLSLLMILATLLLAGCAGGAPGCPQAAFGSGGACTPGGNGGFNGGGGGGGGGGSVKAFAYAVDKGGTIDGYQLSAATFAAIPSYTGPLVPTNAGGVGMAVAQKQFLYVGFAGVYQLYAWTIGSNGSLTAIAGSPYTAPFLDQYINGVGQANMITNPAGTLLFVSAAALGEIYVYQIGSGGVLTGPTSFACPTGFTPMNLAADGLGRYLYVIDGTYSTNQGTQIAAFSIGSGGALTAVTGSPFVYPMWQVQGEPTGQFLIGTSGSSAYNGVPDDNNLYAFAISQSGTNAGAITQVTKQSTTYSPFSIAVQPDTGGNLVYSFSFNDTGTAINPVEGYTISNTGTLTMVSGSPFGNSVGNGTWGQFDQSGQSLFAYSSYSNPTTNTTTTQLVPLAVGTTGALTQPVSTLTLSTPGFWVVTDPQ